MENEISVIPFKLMDCALITLATGKRAMNLRELRDRVAEIEESSLYYHFFENIMRPSFDDPEFRNDFALWSKRGLHDTKLAEKLGMIDPLMCCDLDDLRQRLLDVIEDHLYERDYVPWAKPDREFHFLRSNVVVFDTGRRFEDPASLLGSINDLSTGSIYYHFIDARRRDPVGEDDFSSWLSQWGGKTKFLRDRLSEVDYYVWTLYELRDHLSRIFGEHVNGGEA